MSFLPSRRTIPPLTRPHPINNLPLLALLLTRLGTFFRVVFPVTRILVGLALELSASVGKEFRAIAEVDYSAGSLADESFPYVFPVFPVCPAFVVVGCGGAVGEGGFGFGCVGGWVFGFRVIVLAVPAHVFVYSWSVESCFKLAPFQIKTEK
jgi:hypothetical protein